MAPAAVTPPPAPSTVSPEEALRHPVVVAVPTAGLKERTGSALPRWLAAAFMIIPAFGLIYLSGSIQPGGCEEGSVELAVDRVTGLVQNCDGSDFEGRGGGGGGEFFAMGSEVYTAVANCTGCHGAGGAGGGAIPGLATVMTDFGSCDAQIEWISLGSAGFLAAGRTTYGDTGKPVNGGMPAFGTTLTEEQLQAVVLFERVRFGAGDPEEVAVDCGLAEPEEGAPTDSVPGDTTPGETVPTETTMGEARAGVTG